MNTKLKLIELTRRIEQLKEYDDCYNPKRDEIDVLSEICSDIIWQHKYQQIVALDSFYDENDSETLDLFDVVKEYVRLTM